MEIARETLRLRLEFLLKAELKATWNKLQEEAKKEIEWATVKAAELTLRSLNGEDVEEEVLGMEAVIANWTYTHSSEVERAFWQSLDKIAGVFGRLLGGIVNRVIG